MGRWIGGWMEKTIANLIVKTVAYKDTVSSLTN